MKKRIITLIIAAIATIATFTIASSAESAVTNVSTNCNVTTFQSGDTVTIQVSTKEMSICTFIAYVEYNGDMLEYQGYHGAGGTQSVYLARKENKDAHNTVTVEQSKEGSVVGMYAVGTTEYLYSAAAPLVTLEFKAKTSGEVTNETFQVAETSDGRDGFTSESIKKAIADEDNSTPEKAGTYKSDNSKTALIITIAIILVVIAVATIIIVKQRKNN